MEQADAVQGRSDSWIEISSRPSSSSLSSPADELVTSNSGLQSSLRHRQRRLLRTNRSRQLSSLQPSQNNASSSQEEYEESESESDRVMTSSNEGVTAQMAPGRGLQQQSSSSTDAEGNEGDEEADSDENATALGVGSNDEVFTPQPNAFSHPPSSHLGPQPPGSSYFPATSTSRPADRHTSQRGSLPPQRPTRGSRRPSQPADHDAALRASLTTLLSCAAAARGHPKAPDALDERYQPSSNRIDTNTLRLVPESVALGQEPTITAIDSPDPSSHRRSSRSASSSSKRRNKRKTSSKERLAGHKRLRTASVDQVISPTLLTWVLSAGVLVIASALSFSAGYKMGKESAFLESGSPVASWSHQDTRHTRSGLGLRRKLWSGAAKAVTVSS
ncbi:MAG: hypothetical protein M1828_006172 [Chrysothrix sp. TS-e1954]|nr:MAG: hypothetical protein M1828_006172 [Chrysothrix sp. TS-e1954]